MALKIDFLFYSPEIETTHALDETESLHATKVLRKKAGDTIQVTDGKGGWFTCEITHPHPKKCGLRIIHSEYNYHKSPSKISVGICPTKNADRIEYFLEKSTEIGISEVFFLKSQNTYPKKINLERWERIVVSAMKQALKAYKPTLYGLMDLESFVKNTAEYSQKLVAHLKEDSEDIIQIPLQRETLILIGPEGDFAKDELSLIGEFGFKNVTLGQSRLRTETAGLYAVTILNARTVL